MSVGSKAIHQPHSSVIQALVGAKLSRGVVGFHAPIHEARASFKLGQDEREMCSPTSWPVCARGAHDLLSWMERAAGPDRLAAVAAMRDALRAPSRVAGWLRRRLRT